MALPLAERIATAARRHPENTALFRLGRTVSYGDLLALVRAAEKNTAALRIPAGTLVAVDAAKAPETIAVLLACLRTERPVLVPSADVPDRPLRRLLAGAGALVSGSLDTLERLGIPTAASYAACDDMRASHGISFAGGLDYRDPSVRHDTRRRRVQPPRPLPRRRARHRPANRHPPLRRRRGPARRAAARPPAAGGDTAALGPALGAVAGTNYSGTTERGRAA